MRCSPEAYYIGSPRAAHPPQDFAVQTPDGLRVEKDAFVTPIKHVADDRTSEFETPAKGPKQAPKRLPRPAVAWPGAQKPPGAVSADQKTAKDVVHGSDEENVLTSASAPGQVPKLPPCSLAGARAAGPTTANLSTAIPASCPRRTSSGGHAAR